MIAKEVCQLTTVYYAEVENFSISNKLQFPINLLIIGNILRNTAVLEKCGYSIGLLNVPGRLY